MEKKDDKIARVGLGVLIIKDNKIPLGKRKNSHGEGSWTLPGGHLEFGESFEKCAIREAKEETGLDVIPEKVIGVSNDIAYGKHYVTVHIMARVRSGRLMLMEPDRFDKLEWFSLDDLPSPLFEPTRATIALYKKGKVSNGLE